MRFSWPENTKFQKRVLDVQEKGCVECGGKLHICSHRTRRIYSLGGPLELCCRLVHCSDPRCSGRSSTLSPKAELGIALPGWLVGWDVFCWIGHRRFARHWSIAQIQGELLDSYRITLSNDAIAGYLRRYQIMVAARQSDPQRLANTYTNINGLVLSIDGLQPEKGHETLYVVRELNAKRVWFAEPLLSSNQHEVRRLFIRARQQAQSLGKPVLLWMSDKQDAFLKGVALEFKDVPHRYCANHFLRDLAKPMLAADSTAKVQMRQKVRGLRQIEQAAQKRQKNLESQMHIQKQDTSAGVSATASTDQGRQAGADRAEGSKEATGQSPNQAVRQATRQEQLAQVVLDYCAGVRGILNDDQGGPLSPPGLRMAEALRDIRDSLSRNLALNLPGFGHEQLARLAGCIDRGLAAVKEQQQEISTQCKEIAKVARTLEVSSGSCQERQGSYEGLRKEYENKEGDFFALLAKTMRNWQAGLFVQAKAGSPSEEPQDNLALERWFRLPKRHQRKINGRRHAGVRIVQEGPTLLLTLEAHQSQPGPFSAEDLLPYRDAQEPPAQTQALQRRKIMRKARSKKNASC